MAESTQGVAIARRRPAPAMAWIPGGTFPPGGDRECSCDPQLPDTRIPRKAMKGGSHLCAPNYCRRYRPAARMPQAIDTGTSHLGFRCVIHP
jgi:formylglycine-generating enzyme required for sulfatase activity